MTHVASMAEYLLYFYSHLSHRVLKNKVLIVESCRCQQGSAHSQNILIMILRRRRREVTRLGLCSRLAGTLRLDLSYCATSPLTTRTMSFSPHDGPGPCDYILHVIHHHCALRSRTFDDFGEDIDKGLRDLRMSPVWNDTKARVANMWASPCPADLPGQADLANDPTCLGLAVTVPMMECMLEALKLSHVERAPPLQYALVRVHIAALISYHAGADSLEELGDFVEALMDGERNEVLVACNSLLIGLRLVFELCRGKCGNFEIPSCLTIPPKMAYTSWDAEDAKLTPRQKSKFMEHGALIPGQRRWPHPNACNGCQASGVWCSFIRGGAPAPCYECRKKNRHCSLTDTVRPCYTAQWTSSDSTSFSYPTFHQRRMTLVKPARR